MNEKDLLNSTKLSEIQRKVIGDSEYIYHYTNAIGLEGIIRTNQFWMTERNYLNDLYDKKYPIKIFNNELNRLKSEGIENLDYLRFDDLYNKNDEFILSLSLEGDLSNQWIHYGRNDGYCIVFKIPKLIKYFKRISKKNNLLVTFGPVIYNQEDQLSILSDYILNSGVLFDKMINSGHKELSAGNNIYGLYSYMMSIIKHYNNHAEKEFRVSISPGEFIEYETYTKIKNGVFIPFTKFPPDINSDENEKLPIEKIIIGPYINDNFAEEGLLRLLENNNWNDLPTDFIEKSKSKVRINY